MVSECYGEVGHWVSEVLWYEKNGQISRCGMVFIWYLKKIRHGCSGFRDPEHCHML